MQIENGWSTIFQYLSQTRTETALLIRPLLETQLASTLSFPSASSIFNNWKMLSTNLLVICAVVAAVNAQCGSPDDARFAYKNIVCLRFLQISSYCILADSFSPHTNIFKFNTHFVDAQPGCREASATRNTTPSTIVRFVFLKIFSVIFVVTLIARLARQRVGWRSECPSSDQDAKHFIVENVRPRLWSLPACKLRRHYRKCQVRNENDPPHKVQAHWLIFA